MLLAVLFLPARSASAADDIRIDEFNITCVNGFSNAAFVELTAAGPDQVYDNTIKLRFLNSNGTTRYEMPIGVGALAGQSWPQGRRWLIGYTNFFGTTQVFPDAEMTNVPATSGAVLLVRGTGASASVLDRVDYVNNGAIPAPTLGRSLQRQPDLSWVIKSSPDPTTAAGIVATAASCFQATALGARVSEMQLLCRNGLISGQFIELASTSLSSTRDAAMRLRTYDRNDVLISDITSLFGVATGQPWINGTEWLIGPATLKGPQGQAPDLILPAPLDTVAGRVLFVLVGTNASETVLSDIRYGTLALPRPGYGKSLSYSSGYVENPLPTPKASNTQIYLDPYCDRPWPTSAYLSEMQLQCWDGSTGTQFIELKVRDSGERLWPELQLEALDHNGQTIGTVTDLFGASAIQSWPTNKSWLIASAGIRDAALHAADLALPFSLDAAGGRLVLRDLFAPIGAQVCADVMYGPGGVALPLAGRSLEWNGITFVERAAPSPTGFLGTAYTDAACGTNPVAVSLREAQFRCANGAPSGQFLELGLLAGDESFDSRVNVLFRDHNGTLIHRMTQPFGARTGTAWAATRPWLIADPSFRSPSNAGPDAILPVVLDTLGGSIEIVFVGSTEISLQRLDFGPGGVAMPPFGNSLIASGPTFVPASPTPMGYDLVAFTPDVPCRMPFLSGVIMEELGLQCSSLSPTGQFIELQSTLANERFDARHRIRAFDRNDALIGEFGLTAGSPGAAWPAGSSFLISASAWTSGVSGPDLALPLELDRVAGRIELLGPYGATNTVLLGTISYGHVGESAIPAGASLVRGAGGLYSVSLAPAPRGANNQYYSSGRCVAPAEAPIQISEFGTSCYSGGNSSFIELSSAAGAYHDADIVLLARDHLGAQLGSVTNMFAAFTGASWPETRRWLLGNSSFVTANAMSVGTDLPFALDPLGGSIVMRQPVLGVLTTIDSVAYGPGTGTAAPTPGMSLSRVSFRGTLAPSFPTPTLLAKVAVGAGCFDPAQLPIRISELSTSCPTGTPSGQFLELTATSTAFYYSTLRLRIYNASGALLGESSTPFAPFQDSTWAAGTFVLYGMSSPYLCAGTFDKELPATLDVIGGRVDLVAVTGAGETVVQSLAYGLGSGLPAPGTGQSLSRDGSGQYVLTSVQHPANRRVGEIVLPACNAPVLPLRIERFALTCANGDSIGHFVELRATADFVIPSNLVLQLPTANFAATQIPIAATQVGQIWPAGRSLLLTSSLWPSHLGRCSDGVIPALNPSAGTLRLVQGTGPGCLPVMDAISYGAGQMIGLPQPGVGIRRGAGGAVVFEPWPTPTCANGDTTWLVPCLGADPEPTAVIQEFMLLDGNHSRASQFIELSSSGAGQMWESRTGLRTFDHNGNLIQTLPGTSLSTYTGLWRPGVARLLTTQPTLIGGPSGIEQRLTPLDTLGGRIEVIYQPSDGGPLRVVRSVSYGPNGSVPLPGPGFSAQRMPDGSYALNSLPTPWAPYPFGAALSAPVSGCEYSSIESSTGSVERVGTITYDRLQLIAPTRSTFDKSKGTASASAGPGMTATTYVRDRFTLQAPLGTTIQAIARLNVSSQHLCDQTGCAAGTTIFKLFWAGTPTIVVLEATGSTVINVPITLQPGVSYELIQSVAATQAAGPGTTRRVFADARLEFVGIPAGMNVVSCSGYTHDQAVPTLVSLAEAVATSEGANLRWRLDQGADFEARVQRRQETTDWADVGAVHANGTGELAFTDGTVVAGQLYAYRLTWTEAGAGTLTSGATWLDIPRVLAFALRGARPNPSRGALTVSFQLAVDGDVQLELLDIAGRRAHEYRARLSAGDHALPFTRAGEIRPGMYLLRLRQGDRSATTRVIITR